MPNSIFDASPLSDEKAAYAYVEARIWADGRFCPHCGVVDRSGKLENQRSKSSKINPEGKPIFGLYKCYACRKPFTVKVRTIFEDSHVPMHLWLQAIVMMCASKKGISSNQLHRVLGVTLRTAWQMSHRIRLAMTDGGSSGPLGGKGKVIEADETYIMKQRGRATWEFVNDEGWVKQADRREVIVFALVERGGRVRAEHIENVTSETLRAALKRNASTESALMTDDWRAYQRPGREFAKHETVNHSEEEYVRCEKGRLITTNSVEGFFSILKRGMNGVYQHCSEKHLQRYNDAGRTECAVLGAVGKRLTYRTTHSKAAGAPSA